MALVVCLQPVSFRVGAIACIVIPVVAVRVHTSGADSCSHLTFLAVIRIAGNAIVNSVVIEIIWTCYNIHAHVGIRVQELSINT
jgi:hypothetical protein